MKRFLKINLSNFILILIILANLLAFTNIKIYNIYNSISLYINTISYIIIFILQKKFDKNEIDIIIYLLLFVTYGMFTLIINKGGFGSVAIIISSILSYLIIQRCKISTLFIKINILALLLVNIFLVIKSKNYYEKFLYNQTEYLNSNTVGIVIMFTALYISSFIKIIQYKYNTLFILLIYIISIWGMINCKSRGALLTFFAFLLMKYIIPRKVYINKRLIIFLSILIILFGVIFTYIYVYMYLNNFNIKIPFTNKSFYTGRELIWLRYYNEVLDNPINILFGLGSKADLYSGKDLNLHNVYLTVLTDFGIIGFLLYFSFWIAQIIKIYKKRRLSYEIINFVILFLSVLIYGYVEVSMLWHNMFIFSFMCIGLANNEYIRGVSNEIKNMV